MEGKSCEVLATVGDMKRVPRLGWNLWKKSARFLEIITGRLHPESESGAGARAPKATPGWSKGSLQSPLLYLVLFIYYFFFF